MSENNNKQDTKKIIVLGIIIVILIVVAIVMPKINIDNNKHSEMNVNLDEIPIENFDIDKLEEIKDVDGIYYYEIEDYDDFQMD